MKSKFLLFFFFCIFLLTIQSCKKDNNASVQVNLKGRWDATSGTIETFENNVSKSKTSQVAAKDEFYIVFGDTKIEFYENNKLSDNGTYIYESATQKLTVKYDANNSETLQLAKVSSTNFSLVEEVSEVKGNVTTKTATEIVFTKQ